MHTFVSLAKQKVACVNNLTSVNRIVRSIFDPGGKFGQILLFGMYNVIKLKCYTFTLYLFFTIFYDIHVDNTFNKPSAIQTAISSKGKKKINIIRFAK